MKRLPCQKAFKFIFKGIIIYKNANKNNDKIFTRIKKLFKNDFQNFSQVRK